MSRNVRDYFRPENWLYPYDRNDIDSCESFNDFLVDFPDSFNPSSVLPIDIHNINETRLREQVEKTIAFAFEDAKNDLDSDALLMDKLTGNNDVIVIIMRSIYVI